MVGAVLGSSGVSASGAGELPSKSDAGAGEYCVHFLHKNFEGHAALYVWGIDMPRGLKRVYVCGAFEGARRRGAFGETGIAIMIQAGRGPTGGISKGIWRDIWRDLKVF